MSTPVFENFPKEPSLKYIQQRNFGVPPQSCRKSFLEISKHHIESFNYFLKDGLIKAVQELDPVEFELRNKDRVKLEIREVHITNPSVPKGILNVKTAQVYPSECRNRGTTYGGRLEVQLLVSVNGVPIFHQDRVLGDIPIMVRSNLCNLSKLTPKQMAQKGEDVEDVGGYFIVNGNERAIRLLVLPKRNYPLALKRPGWKGRGKLYSEYGLSIRCVRGDQSAANMVLHYLTTGTATLMFTHKKELFYAPVMMILKGLCDVTDRYIHDELLKGCENNSFFKGCVKNMLLQLHNEGLSSQKQIKKFIGQNFRVKLSLPPWYSDEQITDYIFRRCIAIHLDSNADKFNLLIFMTRKLFAVARGECAPENPDSPMNFETLLSGHVYLMLLKDKLGAWLSSIRSVIERTSRIQGTNFTLDDSM